MTKVARGSRLVGLLLTLALLLAAGGVRAGEGVPPGAPAHDLAWVPADAPGFALFRLGDLWTHQAARELHEQLVKWRPDFEKDMEKGLGVPARELERLLLIFPFGDQDPVVILTTAKPSGEKLRAALLPKGVKKQHRGRTYYEAPAEPFRRAPQAMYAAGDRLFVFGPAAQVRHLIERFGTAKAGGPLGEGIKRAGQNAPLVLCVNLAAYAKDLKSAVPPQAQAALPLFEASPAVVTAVIGADTEIDLRLTFADASRANDGAKALQVVLDLAKQYIPGGRTELAREKPDLDIDQWLYTQTDLLLREIEGGLQSAKVQTRDSTVQARFRLKVQVGTALGVGVLSLGTRSQKTFSEVKPAIDP